MASGCKRDRGVAKVIYLCFLFACGDANGQLSDDHGDTAATATLLTISESASGVIDPADDFDYFRIAVPAGGIRIFTQGALDTVGTLENSAGNELAIIRGGGDRANFALTHSVEETVYVRVTASSTGSYTIQATPLFSDDHGNARVTSTLLRFSRPVSGAVAPATDVDYFRIQASERVPVRVYTTGSLDTVGTLEDLAGNRLATNDNGRDPLNFSLDVTGRGTFYVKVESFGNLTAGSYTIEAVPFLTDDHGDSRVTATLLTLDNPVSGVIDPADDFDYFRIAVPAGGIRIFTQGALETFGRLENSVSSELANGRGGGDRANFALTHSVIEIVYIRVTAPSTGSYTIQATPLFSDDHGNGKVTATPLFLSSPVSGVIDGIDDVDYFKVEIITVGGGVKIFTTGTLDTFGTLEYFSGGDRRTDNDSGEGENFLFRGLDDSDTRYVKVESFGNSTTGSYTIEAVAVSCPSSSFRDPLYGCQWHLKNTGQNGATAGEDINVESVWENYEGEGVHVAVVDGGMYFAHEDLRDNVDVTLNHNYVPLFRSIYSGQPNNAGDFHGTAVSGLVAARGGNGVGIRGVAPRATIYGYNAVGFAGTFDINATVDAMVRNMEVTAVSSNSWGPDNSLFKLFTVPAIWEMAVETGVKQGLGGKGIVYVFAGGNGHGGSSGQGEENSNFNGYASYYAVVAVCAVDRHGRRSRYSEWGANLWICAPSGSRRIFTASLDGVVTTSIEQRYIDNFSGTSAATPIVSGVVALVREANPELTWREIKLILAGSARKNDPANSGWEEGELKYPRGSARYAFNYEYGFGVVDAQAAVDLANGWVNVPPMKTTTISAITETVIPVDSSMGISTDLYINTDIDFTEFVEINVNFTYARSDLEMQLISPSGRVSTLIFLGNRLTGYEAYPFRFGSAKHLGEDPSGKWMFKVSDGSSGDAGMLHSWGLKVYGHTTPGLNSGLSGLTVNAGMESLTLVPPFDTDVLMYRANISGEQRSVVVAATLEDGVSLALRGVAADRSTLTVNGAILSGLTAGENVILVTVTPEDGMTSRTYTVRLAVLEQVALELAAASKELTSDGSLRLLNGESVLLTVRTTPLLSAASQEAVVSVTVPDAGALAVTGSPVMLSGSTPTGQVMLTALSETAEATLAVTVMSTTNVLVSPRATMVNVAVDRLLRVEFADESLRTRVCG